MPIEHGLGGQTIAGICLSGIQYLQVILTSPDGDPYTATGGGGGGGGGPATQSGNWVVGISGQPHVLGAVALTGTVPPFQSVQSGPWQVALTGSPSFSLSEALPAGSNSIGTVVLGAGSANIGYIGQWGPWAVTLSGTNTITGTVAITGVQPTGPVTQSGPWAVNLSGILPTPFAVALTGSLPVPFAVAISGSLPNQPGSASIGNNQVSLSGVANQIVSSRNTRRRVVVQNYGTTDVYLGASGVTTSNGFWLRGVPGANLPVQSQASLWGITTSGVQTVGYLEEYD